MASPSRRTWSSTCRIDEKTPDPARAAVARHGLLGIGHGPEARGRHLRELPRVSAGAAEGYASMADEFGFRVLDAKRKVDVIQDELRRQIAAFLAESDAPLRPRRVGGRADAVYTDFTAPKLPRNRPAIAMSGRMSVRATEAPATASVTVQARTPPAVARPPCKIVVQRPELLLRRRSARSRDISISTSARTWSPRSSARRAAARARSCARSTG